MTRTRIITLAALVAVAAIITVVLIVDGPSGLMSPSADLATWISGLFR